MAGITKWYVVHTYSGYENIMFSSKSLSKQKTTNTSCQTMPGMSSATPAVSPAS